MSVSTFSLLLIIWVSKNDICLLCLSIVHLILGRVSYLVIYEAYPFFLAV